MMYYLLVCRSLTYAQRAEQILKRAGVSAYILRSPKAIDNEGCSHTVKVVQRNLSAALSALSRAGISPQRIYAALPNGGYEEVSA